MLLLFAAKKPQQAYLADEADASAVVPLHDRMDIWNAECRERTGRIYAVCCDGTGTAVCRQGGDGNKKARTDIPAGLSYPWLHQWPIEFEWDNGILKQSLR
jgi:hypothetical protein